MNCAEVVGRGYSTVWGVSSQTLCLVWVASLFSTLPVSVVAQQRSGSFVIVAPNFSSGGYDGFDAAAGASVAQCGPIGVTANGAQSRFVASGFWQAAGGPIAVTGCAGDCDGDGRVTVAELVRAVNIALGRLPVEECLAVDRSGDGSVTISELVRAVRSALDGCSGLAGLVLPPRGASSVPPAFNLQGKLSDLPDDGIVAVIDVEIGVWDSAAGGRSLYSERHSATHLANGVFNVLIGSGSDRSGSLDAGAFADDERWLELKVDGETVGRQPLGALAYALRADTTAQARAADTLAGLEEGQLVSTEGGTFTGPVTFSAVGSGDTVRVGSTPGIGDHGVIAVGDAQGHDLAMMFVDAAEGQGRLAILGADGRELASVGSEAVGGLLLARGAVEPRAGRIVVRGPNGEVNAQLRSWRGDPNHGAAVVHDGEGIERAELFVDTNGGGRVRTYGSGVSRPIRAELFGKDGVVRILDEAGFTAVAEMTSVGNAERDPAAANRGMVLVRDSGRPVAHAAAFLAGPRGEGIVLTRGSNESVNVEIGASREDANTGRLSIYDERSVEKVVADVGTGGAGSVDVADRQGRVRATLEGIGFVVAQSAGGDQGSFLGFTDDSANHGRIGVGDVETGTFAELSVDSQGQGQLQVNGLSGAKATAIRVFAEPDPGLIETRGANGNGNVLLSVLASNANHGLVAVKDAAGDNRALFYAASDARGRASVQDGDGRTRAQLQVSQGAGLVETRGPNGEEDVVLSADQFAPDHGFVAVRNTAGDIRGQFHLGAASADGDPWGRIQLNGPSGGTTVTATSGRSDGNSGFLYLSPGTGAGMDASGREGVYFADLKNFVARHPSVPGSMIVYTAVEGPEAAMYYRGVARLTDGRGEIELPEHFVALASPETITVQLTPGSGRSKGMGFAAIENGRIEIGELHGGTGSYDVYFVVHAVRRGYEDYRPVVEAEAVGARGAMRSAEAAAPAQIEAASDEDGPFEEPEARVEDGPLRTAHGRQS